MPPVLESNRTGNYESWEDVIVNVKAQETPFTSMATKSHKPVDVIDNWQVEDYDDSDIRGVPQDKDADNFGSQSRERLKAVIQKTWNNPGVSDLADALPIHGDSKGEMARQIAKSMVKTKFQIEKRNLSDHDNRETEDPTRGYETRGAGSWLDTDAQTTLPVPEAFRPTAACVYTGAKADFGEEEFKTMMRAGYKLRHGSLVLKAFVGIELLDHMSDFLGYQETVSGKTAVRTSNLDAKAKTLISVVNRIETAAGVVDLHPSSYLRHDLDGVATAGSDLSGFFLDMSKWCVNWVRKPRVVPLENKGGGPRAIVDAIWLNKCLNPKGHLYAKIDS